MFDWLKRKRELQQDGVGFINFNLVGIRAPFKKIMNDSGLWTLVKSIKNDPEKFVEGGGHVEIKTLHEDVMLRIGEGVPARIYWDDPYLQETELLRFPQLILKGTAVIRIEGVTDEQIKALQTS